MKPISYTRAAVRSLRRLPPDVAARIVEKIEQFSIEPHSLANNVKALKGRSGIRLRVGNWRVIMDDGKVLAVLEIGPRSSIYD